jgi:YrbI family 3-deoxy-D-manno-octulosonate 8-phosphate phosphatase
MLNAPISSDISKVKLIIFDVDGVLTNGKKAYGMNGEKLFKSFGDLDFTAMKVMKTLGFSVIWLSGDEVVNQSVAKLKGIPFYCTRQKDGTNVDKITLLPSLLEEYCVSEKQVWFIGDDIFDLNLVKAVGFSSCPVNASFLVKNEVKLIHKNKSGDNIASEVLEILLLNHKIKNVDVSSILERQNLDSLKNNR